MDLSLVTMADGDLPDATVIPMRLLVARGRSERGHARLRRFDSPESGAFTYGVRVRPHHTDLPNPFALAW